MPRSRHTAGDDAPDRPTPPSPRPDVSGGPDATHADGRARETPTEDVHVRNYDVRRTYDIVVRVDSTDGERAFERRYTLRPGQCRSIIGVLDPGRYEVTAALDPTHEQSVECDVGPAPEDAALVEVGNGVVTVSRGLYG